MVRLRDLWTAGIGALGISIGEYWAAAPPSLQSACWVLPVVALLDAVAGGIYQRRFADAEPVDSWRAASGRFALALMLVVLGGVTDQMADTRYSFTLMALWWGCATHVLLTLRHLRRIAESLGMTIPTFLGERWQAQLDRVDGEEKRP